jgi:phosphoglycolate phosphatase-like HAD superfamily hydrolase
MANSVGRAEKIKVVALDFDGVVTSLDIDWKAGIRQASAIVGYEVKSLILFFENNFGTLIFQKVSSEIEKKELEAIRKATVLPYVKEALQKMSEKQVQTYIVSMQSYRVVKEFLDQNGLANYFTGIITRERCPGKKAQVEYLIRIIGLSPSQVLLVDDSKRNISLCSELGVACFLFQGKQNIKDVKKVWDKALDLLE